MDGLFIKDELPDHAAESVKDTILNNASSLDETRWRRTGINKTFESWILCPMSADMESKGDSHRWSLLERSFGRARQFGRGYSFNGRNKTEIECRLQGVTANWSALRGF